MDTPVQGRRVLTRYAMLIGGAGILAFGLYNVHRQSGITEGGVLGLVLLLDHWLGITPAVVSPVLDITCYLIGFRFLGKEFAKSSLAASLGFACWYGLFEQFPPLLPSLGGHPIVAAVVGACAGGGGRCSVWWGGGGGGGVGGGGGLGVGRGGLVLACRWAVLGARASFRRGGGGGETPRSAAAWAAV